MKLGGVRLRFPKWADSAPPRVFGRPKSPGLLGLKIEDLYHSVFFLLEEDAILT